MSEELFEKMEEESELNAYLPATNKKKRGKIARMVTSVLLALACFVGGGFVTWFSLDKEVRLLVRIKALIDKEYYKELSDEVFYGAVFDAVDDELDDYSYYMTADEYKTQSGESAGNRSGIGLVFSTVDADKNPQMRIVRVNGNSPAEEVGLCEGSFVTAFGKSETELIESVVFKEFEAFLADCATGENFVLRVEHEGGTELVSLAKKAYVENYVFYRTSTEAYGFTGKNASNLEKRGAPLACLNADTAYIRIMKFGGTADKNFAKAMDLFQQQGKKNLVLDLRENGGGYVDTMREIASYFCKGATEKKPVVAIADYGEKKTNLKATGNLYGKYFGTDSRICVLADSGTASASEALIGCMVDYGATSYGDICLSYRGGVAKTFGKGIMQSTYYISGTGDSLKLTTAEILWPSGHSIHGRGVLPEDGTKTAKAGETEDEEITLAIAQLF